MNLTDRFLNRTDFTDYEDFKKNVVLSVPDNFNFGYDSSTNTHVLSPTNALWYGAIP